MRLESATIFKLFLIFNLIFWAPFARAQADLDRELDRNRSLLNNLEDDINQIKRQISESRNQAQSVTGQIGLIDKEMALIARKKGLLARQATLLEEKISQNNQLLQSTRRKLEHLKDLYAQRLVYSYKYGRARNIAFVLAAESLQQAYVRYKYLKRVAEYDRNTIQLIDERRKEIEDISQTLDRDLQLKRQNIQTKEREEGNYRQSRQEKAKLLKRINWNQGQYRKQLARKEEEKKHLMSLILTLEQQRRERQTGEVVTIEFDDINKARGKLPWPVQGRVVSRYGKQHNPQLKTYVNNTDIEIESQLGTPVRSVFSGVARMITYLPGYGNTVIIEHGNGFYTVYGHLDEIYLRKDDIVQTGQVIATVGDSGSLSGARLQFGIYGANKTYDPEQWLKK